jgi:hypothetical protein
MKRLSILIFLFINYYVSGQNTFNGVLISRQDSTPLSFAVIKLLNTEKITQTNANGEFHFKVPTLLNQLTFEISAIGVRDTVKINYAGKGLSKIFVKKSSLSLSEVCVKGLSAVQTVQKAVEMIPVNYTDSSFAAFSFYREYEKINDVYQNLIESNIIVLFSLSTSKSRISSDYAYRILQIRRSDINYAFQDLNYYGDEIGYFMKQNPVYNIPASSLNPNAFSFYTFNFDTTNKTKDFVIIYKCFEFSSESHGLDNFSELDLMGEGWEEGKITIDHETFAFKKIERTAYRNKNFNYPKNNNFVLPSRKYYEEFTGGNLVVEYQCIKGKYFLKKICHRYTNEYFNSRTLKKEFTIEKTCEWYCDSLTHFLVPELLDNFYKEPNLSAVPYTYNNDLWNRDGHSFFYFPEETVYSELEKSKPLQEQFLLNGLSKSKEH